MRVNVYAEEMTERIEIISKEIDGHVFTGLRIYLELPVTVGGAHGINHRSVEGPTVFPPINGEPAQVAGPFMHRPGDDDSSAVTFWGKRDLREVLKKALSMLDEHYDKHTLEGAHAWMPLYEHADVEKCAHCVLQRHRAGDGFQYRLSSESTSEWIHFGHRDPPCPGSAKK